MASQLWRLKSFAGSHQIVKCTHRLWSHANPCRNSSRVVITNDSATIVCWHPEPTFPYECSRPLPEEPTRIESVLNADSATAYTAFGKKSDEVVRQELMKITHTTKHRWFPRARDKFIEKVKPDREYL